jgi:L-alanine-DL-glutamate epimerase-like enolase superfamily enzyme
MGLESALLDFQRKTGNPVFSSDFTEGKTGVKINGLIWLGKPDFMRKQIQEKIDQGYTCLKLKIGAIDFSTELSLIKDIRKKYTQEQIQIRVDANGAFSPDEAMIKLEALAKYGIHSIEQPIQSGNIDKMAYLCKESPVPIALDEELINHYSANEKQQLINEVLPQYIILKPSLHGSFTGCNEWISVAKSNNVDWWITSALESNIGLNIIAQWTATLGNNQYQGLGTGQLYTNNFASPLFIKDGQLRYDKNLE